MARIIILIVVGILALVGGCVAMCVGGAFWLTSGPVKAADEFLERIAKGDVEGAYASTHPDFQIATSLDEFKEFVESRELQKFRSASWSSRSVDNSTGEVRGTVEIEGVGPVKAFIVLVKTDEWRVVRAVIGEDVTTGGEEVAPTIPQESEVREMVADSMSSFANAVNNGSFVEFHAEIAEVWKQQITAEELKAVFREFIEKKIDLSPVAKMEARFDRRPALEDTGILRVEGHFESQPVTRFNLGYLQEAGAWRLASISVNLGNSSSG
ncbi:MAG: hypothetical protein AKCLJLPJ_00894 [Fimbriimonadales bacterium]|nr:hypothetical protein [Fimbriimonadales bacterium]